MRFIDPWKSNLRVTDSKVYLFSLCASYVVCMVVQQIGGSPLRVSTVKKVWSLDFLTSFNSLIFWTILSKRKRIGYEKDE